MADDILTCPDCGDVVDCCEHIGHIASARAEERRRCVAWLRRVDSSNGFDAPYPAGDLADRIERGEHEEG